MSLFGRKKWELVEHDVTEFLKDKLGEINFKTFTELCDKYKLFQQLSQLASIDTGYGPERPLDLRIIHLVALFTNVGNALGQQYGNQGLEILKDGIEFSKVALLLNPDHYPARADLAFAYNIMGQTQEAKEEATRAVIDLDKALAFEKSNPLPPSIEKMMPISDEGQNDLRNTLVVMSEGRMPGE